MKKIILLLFLLISLPCISQNNWNRYTFTSGFVDRNPSFTSKYNTANNNLFIWEFMVFERYTGSNSQICVLKIGKNGPIDTVRHLTYTATQKRFPSISCIPQNFYPGIRVPYALIIWEEYQNSRWNLHASSYDSLSGWSLPYAFDTSNVNKSNVKIIGYDSPVFTIVYERNNDIIFRQFNSQTRIILNDTNLTINEPANCGNPSVVYVLNTNFLVAYEKLKPDNKKAIYYRFKTGANTWAVPDTAAYAGNNIISEFAGDNFLRPELAFHSDRTGKYRLYSTLILTSGQNIQSSIFSNLNNSFNYSYFKVFLYPIITDAIAYQVYSFLRKSDSTKLFCSNGGPNDSTTLGDTSLNIKPSINRGIYMGSTAAVWIAYTKDSLSFSNIYAKRTTVIISNINNIGNTIPEKCSLFQNYPNPFNPTTKIKFEIPPFNPPLSKGGRGLPSGGVTLKVYNILGREIQTLVNESLNPGTYELTFDGSNLSSGIYFYQLRAGEYIETKKLVLLK